MIRELLAKNRARTLQWGLVLMAGLALIGAGLTFLIISPLNGLYRKALDTIQEYSGGSDLDVLPGENEISTLVRANDVMLETIKNHLAERTRAEEAFHETSGTLHALIEASPLAVIVGDADGIVRVWNPAAVRMFGWSESETIGRPTPSSPPMEPWSCGRPAVSSSGGRDSPTRRSAAGRERLRDHPRLLRSAPPRRPGEGLLHHGDHGGHHRGQEGGRGAPPERGATPAVAEDGSGREAGGRRRARLQQPADGHHRVQRDPPDRTVEGNPMRREIEEIHKAGERAASLTHQLLAFSRRQVLKPQLLRMNEIVENLGICSAG